MKTTKLSKQVPIKTHEVWHPRYSKKDVLVPAYKVAKHNRIIFTKAEHLADQEFYFDGEQEWEKTTNGTAECVVIPLDELQRLEIEA